MNNLTISDFINLYDKCIVCGDKIEYTLLFAKKDWNTFPGSIYFELEDKTSLTFKKAGLTCLVYKSFNFMEDVYNLLPMKIKVGDKGATNNKKFDNVFEWISLRAQCKDTTKQNYTDHFYFNTQQKRINNDTFSLSSEKVYAHGINIKYDHTYQQYTASTSYSHTSKMSYHPLIDFPFDSKEKLENKINAILLLQ